MVLNMKILCKNKPTATRILQLAAYMAIISLAIYSIIISTPLPSHNKLEAIISKHIEWGKINVNTITPKQIIDYFHWTNGSSCSLVNDFGGVVMTPSRLIRTLGGNPWKTVEKIPGGIDGQYPVCLDPTPPPPNHCLVYSFGINNEWSFDEAMETYGCQVYSFDGSMKLADHHHGRNIHFYDLFLSSSDDKMSKSLTLSSIYRMLVAKHGEVVIDYLKIDIEHEEWEVLPEIIQSGMLKKVRQMAVEVHLTSGRDLNFYRKCVATLRLLENAGMVRFDSKYNPFCPATIEALEYTGSICFQIAWYNVNFIPLAKLNSTM